MRINHPPYYYLSEVETNVVQRSLEPFSRELFANQFLCNAASNLKASLLCRTMHCENLPTHSCLLISAVQDPPTHLHWTLAKISSMRCFIMHLVLNIARQFVERKILNQFAVIQCSTYSDPPLIAKKKTILCKPSHMWRSSMQKRWSGNQNAVQYLMQHCALQTPLVGTKTRNLEKPRKDFCRNWKLVLENVKSW